MNSFEQSSQRGEHLYESKHSWGTPVQMFVWLGLLALVCYSFAFHVAAKDYLIVDDNWILRNDKLAGAYPTPTELTFGQGRPVFAGLMELGRSMKSMDSAEKYRIIRILSLFSNTITLTIFAWFLGRATRSIALGSAGALLLLGLPSFCIYYTGAAIVSFGLLFASLSAVCLFLAERRYPKRLHAASAWGLGAVFFLFMSFCTYQATATLFCAFGILAIFGGARWGKMSSARAVAYPILYLVTLAPYTLGWSLAKKITRISVGVGYSPGNIVGEFPAKLGAFFAERVLRACDFFNFGECPTGLLAAMSAIVSVSGLTYYFISCKKRTRGRSLLATRVPFLAAVALLALSDLPFFAAPMSNANKDNFTLLIGLQAALLCCFCLGLYAFSEVALFSGWKWSLRVGLGGVVLLSFFAAADAHLRLKRYHVDRFTNEWKLLKGVLSELNGRLGPPAEIRVVDIPYPKGKLVGKNEYGWASFGSSFYTYWTIRNALESISLSSNIQISFYSDGTFNTPTYCPPGKEEGKKVWRLKVGGEKSVTVGREGEECFESYLKKDTAEVGAFTFTGTAAYPSIVRTQSLEGRSIRIELMRRDAAYLNLAEVEVIGRRAPSSPPVNLGLKQPAVQSSTAAGGLAVASLAVDGNTDGDFAHGSVSHTNLEPGAWWEVDLGGTCFVDEVRIWNRSDGVVERLSNFRVVILSRQTSEIASYLSSGTDLRPAVIYTAQKLARTIRIESLEQGPIKLQIAELEVLGRTDESSTTINLALHRPAIQSSDDDGDPASASRAVDGKSNSDCKVTSTQSEARPWWEVDLGKHCRIEEIRIWGPNDPKNKSLNNFRICLLDRPSNTKLLSTGEKQKKSLLTNLKLFFKKVWHRRGNIDLD